MEAIFPIREGWKFPYKKKWKSI